MEQEIIKICNECKKPIFWTFAFPGAEWYCPSCGTSRDMFFGEDVKATETLKKERRILAIKWGQIKKHLFMGGERVRDCKKCFPIEGQGEYHSGHLTPKEEKKMKWARERLGKIRQHLKHPKGNELYEKEKEM